MSSKLVECFVYAWYRVEWPCCPDGHRGHDGSREVGQQPIHHQLSARIPRAQSLFDFPFALMKTIIVGFTMVG